MWIAPQVDVTMIHAAGEEVAKPVGRHDADHKRNHQLQGARQLKPQNRSHRSCSSLINGLTPLNHMKPPLNHRNGNQQMRFSFFPDRWGDVQYYDDLTSYVKEHNHHQGDMHPASASHYCCSPHHGIDARMDRGK